MSQNNNNARYIALNTMESVIVNPPSNDNEIPVIQNDENEYENESEEPKFDVDAPPKRRNTLSHCYHSKYFWFAICHCILIILLVTFGLLLFKFLNPDSDSDTEPDSDSDSQYPFSNSTSSTSTTTEPILIELPCPEGYIFFQQTASCYKLHRTPTTFFKAEHTCLEEHAHLASIHSDAENNVVFGLYHSQLFLNTANQGAWLGLHYTNETWSWMDGSDIDYMPWDTAKGQDRDSRVFMPPYSTVWRGNGEYQKMFVCKKPANGVVLQNTNHSHKPCKLGYSWFEHSGQCYKALTQPETFEKAKSMCGAEKASIANVHSEIENLFLIGFLFKNLRLESHEVSPVAIWIKNEMSTGELVKERYSNWGEERLIHRNQYITIDTRTGKWISNGRAAYTVCMKY